jgi:hypothetical protein
LDCTARGELVQFVQTQRVFSVSPEHLGTVVPKLNRGKMQKARWRTDSDKQAFLGVTNHTELDLRGGTISIELFAFVSRNSDASEDTPFSSEERP